MTPHDATTGIRLEGTPQSAARAAFMALLDAHEHAAVELWRAMHVEGPMADTLEQFRVSRRAVVAAYDHATLGAGRADGGR